MSQSINIVKLIEENPNTKLSNSYQGKLINKLKDGFSTEEQQLFISSFYCYLNYKSDDFVIDLDDIWNWLGFTRKDNTKRLLEKIRIKTELLNYEIKNNKISLIMIKKIKLYLINQIKNIYRYKKFVLMCLQHYLYLKCMEITFKSTEIQLELFIIGYAIKHDYHLIEIVIASHMLIGFYSIGVIPFITNSIYLAHVNHVL